MTNVALVQRYQNEILRPPVVNTAPQASQFPQSTRNEIERLFRRLKGFRRIFSRFEKLDVIFLGFFSSTLIVEALRLV